MGEKYSKVSKMLIEGKEVELETEPSRKDTLLEMPKNIEGAVNEDWRIT